MNCRSDEEYNALRATVDMILIDQKYFVNEIQQSKFQRYFKDEWETYIEKWAGHLTSKFKHFGCTTTQRAESGHAMLKRGMSIVQPLDVSFDCLVDNLADFERGYKQIELKEKNEVDVLVSEEVRLKKLVGKISHRALIAIRAELKRDVDSTCHCLNSINYDIPCCHQLSQYKERLIDTSYISPRWFLNSDVRESPSKILSAKPWINYVIALETAFRNLEDSGESINELIESLDNIPEIKNALGAVETNIGAIFSLPKSADVKYPGRKPNLPRLSKLGKDYTRPEYRKRVLLYGRRAVISAGLDRKDEKQQDESIKETHIGIKESILTNLQKNKLYIPKKRKLNILNEKNYNSYEKEDLYKPQKKRINVNEKQFYSDLHSSIAKDSVKSVYDPVGDGHCGYRAISHIRYKEEENFRQVKADMLVALEKNKDIYKNIFIYDVDRIEENIRACMDENSSGIPQWFITPDCAQVVADTYDVPVCVYPHSSRDPPLTFLPVRTPTKPKIKFRPYVIQNKSNLHWLAVDFNHLQTQFPPVQSFYFNICPEYPDLFQQTWNYYGQFPKIKSKQSTEEKKKEKVIELD